MSNKRIWVLVLVAAFVPPLVGTVPANADHVAHHGYFHGNNQSSGDNVWQPWVNTGCGGGSGWALPASVTNANSFISHVKCRLSGGTQDHVGAAYIISTMIGQKSLNPSSSQIAEFEARVRYAESRGWINFSARKSCSSSNKPKNTYYQTSYGDIAWYLGCPSVQDTPWGGYYTPSQYDAITFYNGSQEYVIARFCANPIGDLPPLADDLDFNMSGRSTVNNSNNITATPNQVLTFRHYLKNGGPTSTGSTSINYVIRDTIGGGQVLSGNAGTFNPNVENMVREHTVTVPANATPGSQICRRIEWNPDTETGGSQVGSPACATVQYNFSLTPSIGVQITSAGGPVSGIYAEQGDSATFTYRVNNTGNTVSQTVTCTYRQATHVGHSTAAPTSTFTPSGADCAPSRTFPANTNTTIVTETVALNTGNRSVCRSLTISPVTQGGGSSPPAQACVHVTTKPYFRVYGGDISAGAGIEAPADSGVCTQNNQTALSGWNRLSAGGWGGAGVQYAVQALSRIYQVASSTWGSAQAPAGLSFANTTTSDIPGGDFGGRFGSVPCIADYYATKPADLGDNMTNQNLDSYGTGIFFNNGNMHFTAPGNVTTIDPGQETIIYVNGDVHLSTNVHYTGSWNPTNIPIFRLIVRGNIYVDASVTRLDGVYIAQPDGSNGGVIYSCAIATPGPYTAPGSSNFPTSTVGARCGNKLTVNGSFIAKQVQLWRTPGSVRQSASEESNGSSNIAEVFNYSPALWINQPGLTGGRVSPDYDAIVSLPPVL